jgi:acetyltransferase-like isoleucine patch superfamily enzyme
MKPVIIPTPDVNSEHGVVVAWFADNHAWVDAEADLAEVETSKAVLEVVAPESGYVLHLAAVKDEIALTSPVAILFESLDELKAHETNLAAQREALKASGPRASVKAIQRAGELGVDLSTLDSAHLITVKDVEAAFAGAQPVDYSNLPLPLQADPGVQRVLLIGGGLGATQVIDIFASSSDGRVTTQKAVAVLDDKREKWGSDVVGVPIVGGPDRLEDLFKTGTFDAAVIAISTSVAARKKFRELCESLNIPLANAIDPTSKIATGVVMGTGNVICAFCHFGFEARIGDNNFFSAYNSFDHHNVIANDVSTGPGNMTSSRVKLGNQVRLGTGIHIEPGVELGDRVQVASGATIVRSVPADHVVKTKVVTTTVVPARSK